MRTMRETNILFLSGQRDPEGLEARVVAWLRDVHPAAREGGPALLRGLEQDPQERHRPGAAKARGAAVGRGKPKGEFAKKLITCFRQRGNFDCSDLADICCEVLLSKN